MTTKTQPARPCHDLVTVNTRNVPKAVRDKFKSYCAGRGYTMEATVIAMMKKASREDKPLPEARKLMHRKPL